MTRGLTVSSSGRGSTPLCAEAVVRGGSILVTGLGLGLVVEEILRRGIDRVRCVTVVENSAEVIELTAPTLRDRFGSAVDIVQGDAFKWTPPNGAHFSTCWHDIWPDPEAPGVLEQVRQVDRPAIPRPAAGGASADRHRAVAGVPWPRSR